MQIQKIHMIQYGRGNTLNFENLGYDTVEILRLIKTVGDLLFGWRNWFGKHGSSFCLEYG